MYLSFSSLRRTKVHLTIAAAMDYINCSRLMYFQAAIPSAVGTMLLITILVAAITYRHRVAMFVRFNVHLFDVDECRDEDMIYDVFLTCSYEDREIGYKIRNWLEQGEPVKDGETQRMNTGGYKVCYNEHDFTPPGALISETIQSAIVHSKRVVCALTQNYIHSEYCMLEFRAAWDRNFKLKKRRLVVIKWPDVDGSVPAEPQQHQQQQLRVIDEDRVSLLATEQTEQHAHVDTRLAAAVEDVKLFLSTHTYIDYTRADWWQQLMYALPINRLNPGQFDNLTV